MIELTPQEARAANAALASAGLTLVKRADGKRVVERPQQKTTHKRQQRRLYPVSKLNTRGTQTHESNVYIVDRNPRMYARATKRSVLIGRGRQVAELIQKQGVTSKMTQSNEPPFTEPVPNPPVGVEAQERVQRNLDAAVERGDDKAAEGYAQQLADPTTPYPGAVNEGRGAENEPTPQEAAEGAAEPAEGA